MDQDKKRETKKRVNLSLDKQTLDDLHSIKDINGYGSISSAIRIMVKKYGAREMQGNVESK